MTWLYVAVDNDIPFNASGAYKCNLTDFFAIFFTSGRERKIWFL